MDISLLLLFLKLGLVVTISILLLYWILKFDPQVPPIKV